LEPTLNMTADDTHLALEKAVMDLLLAGDDPVLEVLRQQYQFATATKRMFSGVGFLTDFQIPADMKRIEIEGVKSLFFLSDVGADFNGRSGMAGFHAQVKSGKLKVLEGFAYDEPWPMLMSFDVYYKYPPAVAAQAPDRPADERVMDYVQSLWH
jgi:hypothetical protein